MSDKEREFGITFSLDQSDDYCTVTLTCVAEEPISPDEYAEALIAFAKQLDLLSSLDDVTKPVLN